MVWKQKTRPVTVLHANAQGCSQWSEKIVIDHVAFRKMFLFLLWIETLLSPVSKNYYMFLGVGEKGRQREILRISQEP